MSKTQSPSLSDRGAELASALSRSPARLHELSAAERLTLGQWLRDQFFALSSRERSAGGEETFRSLVAALPTPPTVVVEGLSLCFHPTAQCKLVRFVEEERLPAEQRPLFARPVAELPHLCAVFVDPEELSYRTFENIIPLDRYFAHGPLDLSLGERQKLGSSGEIYSFRVSAAAAAQKRLLELDRLDLYVAPINAHARGGERFIFHSARLGEVLTSALRSALPKSLLKGFAHVNPVFRVNRFEPGDRKFLQHTDTPYYDAAQQQVSRYTLLLYLTGGKGHPTLRIGEEVALEQIDAMTCVIFDQALAHEGAAYEDGRKVFLRSELIFKAPKVAHDPAIAKLFAKACYLTGESIFAAELGRYADACYDRVARAHFAGLSDEERSAPTPYVHKEFRGVHFVASGYDFWFPKGHLTLPECAAIALLDTFNCTLGGAAFHKLCTTQVLPPRAHDEEWIPSFLAQWRDTTAAEPALGTLDKRSLFPPAETASDNCCPFHAMTRFDATRCGDIVKYFTRVQKQTKEPVFAAPLVLMGQEIFLDAEQFVVEPGRIHILSEARLAPVNFAACWNFGGYEGNYIDVAETVEVLQPLVPPILYVETATCYHLMFDFFRNSWTVPPHRYKVPLPRISDVSPGKAEDEGKTPWLTAARRANPKRFGNDEEDQR